MNEAGSISSPLEYFISFTNEDPLYVAAFRNRFFGVDDENSSRCVFMDGSPSFCVTPPVFDIPPPPIPPWISSKDSCSGSLQPEASCQRWITTWGARSTPGEDDASNETGGNLAVAVTLVAFFVLIVGTFFVTYIYGNRKNVGTSETTTIVSGGNASSSTSSSTLPPHCDVKVKAKLNKLETKISSHVTKHSPPDIINGRRTFSSLRSSPASVKPFSAGVLEPNHYIPDTVGRSPSSRPSLMKLSSDRPEYDFNQSPHIIIGGQPFYLIPSYLKNEENNPIYEEIIDDSTSTSSHSYANQKLPQFLPMNPPRIQLNPLGSSISNKQSPATSRSVYYYSDTLRRKNSHSRHSKPASSTASLRTGTPLHPVFRLSDDSDSGISGSGQSPMIHNLYSNGNVSSATESDMMRRQRQKAQRWNNSLDTELIVVSQTSFETKDSQLV